MGKIYDNSTLRLQEMAPPGLEITEIFLGGAPQTPTCKKEHAFQSLPWYSVQLSVPPSQFLRVFWLGWLKTLEKVSFWT